jgi:hypothetical protein
MEDCPTHGRRPAPIEENSMLDTMPRPIYAVFILSPTDSPNIVKRKLWKNTPDREKAEWEVKALKVHGFDAVIETLSES